MNGQSENNLQKRVLFLGAIPNNKLPLKVLAEFTIMQMAREQGISKEFYNIFYDFAISYDGLLKLTRRVNPNIIHFSLHGNKSKGLYFIDESNSYVESVISLEHFDYIFSVITKKIQIEGIIISACNSYEFGKIAAKYVDYAIVMNDFIADEAAVKFARSFYASIFDQQVYDIEQAIDWGRMALFNMDLTDANGNKIKYHNIPKLIRKDKDDY